MYYYGSDIILTLFIDDIQVCELSTCSKAINRIKLGIRKRNEAVKRLEETRC